MATTNQPATCYQSTSANAQAPLDHSHADDAPDHGNEAISHAAVAHTSAGGEAPTPVNQGHSIAGEG